MGKGAANASLPDPLRHPAPATQGAGGTDDLLSQLAGDEIDRLLADAEIETPPAASPVPATRPGDVAGAPASDRITDAAALDDAIASAAVTDDVDAEREAPVEPSNAAGVEPIDSELDDLFKQLTATDGDTASHRAEATPQATTAAPVTETDTAMAPADATDAPVTETDDEADATRAERAGLGFDPLSTDSKAAASAAATPVEPSLATTTDFPDVDARPDFDDLHAQAPLPIWLRPLEWLSAPLDDAPEAFRDVVGKAAIVTLVNAAAVIVYVMFFRQPG
jgi:hypothetical protein